MPAFWPLHCTIHYESCHAARSVGKAEEGAADHQCRLKVGEQSDYK